MGILRFFIVLSVFCLLSYAAVEDVLVDDTMTRLEGEIKTCIRKQGIIAHNIANADVEGYEPIRFEDELKEIKNRPGFAKDKVVVEEEMAKMTKNRLRHQTYLKLYSMKMQAMKQVISQGK